MAIDFDAIKRKLERLSGANKNRSSTWKPTEGEEHTVRLIAFTDNDGQPFKEIQWYYNCLLYTSPSPRDVEESRMPSSA